MSHYTIKQKPIGNWMSMRDYQDKMLDLPDDERPEILREDPKRGLLFVRPKRKDHVEAVESARDGFVMKSGPNPTIEPLNKPTVEPPEVL